MGKASHDRVKLLIKDTITLLCKNGIDFSTKFSIEATIGVTIDDNDVFLLSMNELIKSESAVAAETEQEKERLQDLREKPRRRKRKRSGPKIKTEPGESVEDSSDDSESSEGNEDGEKSFNYEIVKSSDEPKVKKQMTESDNEEEEEEDLVFVKEEGLDDSMWTQQEQSQTYSDYDQNSFIQGTSEVDFSSSSFQEGQHWQGDMAGPSSRGLNQSAAVAGSSQMGADGQIVDLKRPRRYTKEDLDEALYMIIEKGMTKSRASLLYGIPRTTLYDREARKAESRETQKDK